MPRVMINLNNSVATLSYVVDSPVGLGCGNRREDVLLVQHMLRVAWEDSPLSKGFRPPGETKPLNADGVWGPVSTRFLKFFQEEAKRRGANVLLDQRVDPPVSGTSQGANSKTFYTTLALNSARNARRMATQANIAADAGFPGELVRYLYVDWGA